MPAAVLADLLSVSVVSAVRRGHPAALFIRHRQGFDRPKLLKPGSDLCPAMLVAPRRVFLQRFAIGGRNRALGRQDAGGRTARNSAGSNELGHRCLAILFRHDLPRPSVDHRMPRSRQFIIRIGLCAAVPNDPIRPPPRRRFVRFGAATTPTDFSVFRPRFLAPRSRGELPAGLFGRFPHVADSFQRTTGRPPSPANRRPWSRARTDLFR